MWAARPVAASTSLVTTVVPSSRVVVTRPCSSRSTRVGFTPVRTRLGFAYADDCLELGFTWRRDYISIADAQEGSSFRFHFALRNLNFR